MPCAGQIAQAGPYTLNTMMVGCLPILNRLLKRMKLEEFFCKHLKPDGPRTRLWDHIRLSFHRGRHRLMPGQQPRGRTQGTH
jgi:hypothetical protein